MANNQDGRGQNQGQENNSGNFANDPDRASKAGHEGGMAAQRSGNAHEFTDRERSEGGSNSGGNFKNDPDRASEAGEMGGRN